MTQPNIEGPAAPAPNTSGCRILAVVALFGVTAIAILAICGVIALFIMQNQGLLADQAPPTPTTDRFQQDVLMSPVPTRGPTDTATPTNTFTPVPTRTPLPTNTPTDTPEASETPVPTTTRIPATAAPQQPSAPQPTNPPTAAPAASGQGLTAQFSVENTTLNAGEKAWFNFTLNNPTGAAVPWGILGVAVEQNGQNLSDLFQTSWTSPNEYTPLNPGASLTWRDGVTIPYAGTFILHLAICYPDLGACQSSGGTWEYLGPAITVTAN